jgi:SAM-dependent methyltransferase
MKAAPVRDRNDIRQDDDLVDAWWRPDAAFASSHWLAAARGRLLPEPLVDGEVLLDLGCGGGLMAPYASAYRHVGVDLSASALGVADRHGVLVVRGDAAQLPVADGAATVVVGVEGVALLLAEVMPMWLVASYAAVYVGVAQAALAAGVEHVAATSVREPTCDGAPRLVSPGTSPWVRQRLGRADAQVEAARLTLDEAARQVDANRGDPETSRWVYRAKLLAGDTAFAVAASLAEAGGLGALLRGGELERLLPDARSGAVMPPSSDVAANVLGAKVLGVDPGRGLGARPW